MRIQGIPQFHKTFFSESSILGILDYPLFLDTPKYELDVNLKARVHDVGMYFYAAVATLQPLHIWIELYRYLILASWTRSLAGEMPLFDV